jgi:hypothetical protein
VTKRTVTIIETHQIVIVRRTGGAAQAWCPACLQRVEMVPLEEAALWAGVSLRDICLRVGADDIHFVETANGGLICLNSLLKEDLFGRQRVNPDGADVPAPSIRRPE